MGVREDWDRASPLVRTFYLTAAAIGMICGLYRAHLFFDYRDRLPAEPQEQTAQIYPVNIQGRTLYGTKAEQRRYHAAGYIFVGSVLTMAVTSWLLWRRELARAA